MLFRIPICGVPGIPVSLDVDFQKTTEEEWKAVLDSLNLLTSRPNWVEMILAVWEKVEDELPESVEKYAGANFYFRVCNLTDAIMKDDGRSQEPILCTEGS